MRQRLVIRSVERGLRYEVNGADSLLLLMPNVCQELGEEQSVEHTRKALASGHPRRNEGRL